MPRDSRQLLVDFEVMKTLNGVLCDEQTSTSSQRQGTRNCPPTMKAPEEIADGLLGTKRKGRWNDSQSRSSRRACRNVEPQSLAQNTDPATARESNARMDIEYVVDKGSRMLGNSHVQSERKGIH